MKKLVVIAALALLATSPALAKSRHHAASPAAAASFNNAYGSLDDPSAVRLGSAVVGHDPDANIRTRIWIQSQSGGLYSR